MKTVAPAGVCRLMLWANWKDWTGLCSRQIICKLSKRDKRLPNGTNNHLYTLPNNLRSTGLWFYVHIHKGCKLVHSIMRGKQKTYLVAKQRSASFPLLQQKEKIYIYIFSTKLSSPSSMALVNQVRVYRPECCSRVGQISGERTAEKLVQGASRIKLRATGWTVVFA